MVEIERACLKLMRRQVCIILQMPTAPACFVAE